MRWRCTLLCNYTCPMCVNGTKRKKESPVNKDVFLSALIKLKPKILDITGGEPLLKKNIIDIIAVVSKMDNVNLAITTNASVNLDYFVMNVSPKNFTSFVCSFHPEHTSEQHFLSSVLLLKSRGFNPRINIVPYPLIIFGIKHYKSFFEKHGLCVHVDKYIAHKDCLYIYSEKEMLELRKYMSKSRLTNLEAYPFRNEKSVICNAGIEVINVTPDFDVYPCLLNDIKRRKKLGNLKDADFSLRKKKIVCRDHHDCANCDRDHVNIVSKIEKAAQVTPEQP